MHNWRSTVKRSTKVYKGNALRDGKAHSGWFVGRFISQRPRRTERVEVKMSVHHNPYRESESSANRTATSMALITSGSCEYRFRIGKRGQWRRVLLRRPGDYVIWEPGVYHSLRVSKRCEMVVVRWPSAGRSDKTRAKSPWLARR